MTASVFAVPTTYVAWHCRECGDEHETDRYSGSYPVKCRECGKETTRQGFPRRPVNRAWCDSEPRQYNLLNTEKDTQVYLEAVTGERIGSVMPPDKLPDCYDDPIDVARQVLHYRQTGFLFGGNSEETEAVLNAMIACREQSEANARQNRIHELRKEIVLGIAEYQDLLEEQAESEASDG